MTTNLENFIATTAHRRPARILYRADFIDDLKGRLIERIGTEDVAGHYGLFEPAQIQVRRPDDAPAHNYACYYEDENFPEGTMLDFLGVAHVPGSMYHFTHRVSPLRNATSLKDLEDYPLDNMSGWDFSYMADEVEKAHAAGKVAEGWVGHMYESAWQIRDYQQFLMDMVTQPAWAQCLLDRRAEQNMIRAVAFARAGVDLIKTGDDVANQNAMMFAPAMWREMMLSRWTKIWRQIKSINPDAKIWYHSDGNIFDIVGDLVEAGVDILNPLQPECLNVDEIHNRYGDRLTFDGTIGTQSTMPFGSPDDVRARVKDVIEKFGLHGGLIVSPTHVLEPEVPLENIDALFDACRQFGTFE